LIATALDRHEGMAELVIRLARCPEGSWPQPIYSANTVERIECSWLAISRCDAGKPADPETFILYFLDGRGLPQEALQYETEGIAIDQAHAITAVGYDQWKSCSVAVGDGSEVLPLEVLGRC
jgi:hypothetical protein